MVPICVNVTRETISMVPIICVHIAWEISFEVCNICLHVTRETSSVEPTMWQPITRETSSMLPIFCVHVALETSFVVHIICVHITQEMGFVVHIINFVYTSLRKQAPWCPSFMYTSPGKPVPWYWSFICILYTSLVKYLIYSNICPLSNKRPPHFFHGEQRRSNATKICHCFPIYSGTDFIQNEKNCAKRLKTAKWSKCFLNFHAAETGVSLQPSDREKFSGFHREVLVKILDIPIIMFLL